MGGVVEAIMAQDDLEYHVERARVELDLAYKAKGQSAADAHMRLASLHMKCVGRTDNVCDDSGVSRIH